MRVVKRKVFAYITHGDRLLVLGHPLVAEAGIQVPAGTMRADESPEGAVLREAREETGLDGLALVRFLGEHVRDMADWGLDQLHHRFFYHLRCPATPPERWRHHEPDPDGGGEPPLFELSWVRLPDELPDLEADHGIMLPALIEHLRADGVLAAQRGADPATRCNTATLGGQ